MATPKKSLLNTQSPRVSLITCTGGRQEAFSLLESHISKQTFKQFEWIVVDDCLPVTTCTMQQKYYRGPDLWEPGTNTQRANMNLALEKAQGEFIFVIEDDDYYAPQYLAQMMSCFTNSMAVGLSNSKYYKVDMPGWKTMKNYEHASLSQTAFNKNILPIMKWALHSGHFYFDIEFWKELKKRDIAYTLIANSTLSVGIKGMPGRDGLTPSHKDSKGYMVDTSYTTFKKWLGSATLQYESFLKKRRVALSATQTLNV